MRHTLSRVLLLAIRRERARGVSALEGGRGFPESRGCPEFRSRPRSWQASDHVVGALLPRGRAARGAHCPGRDEHLAVRSSRLQARDARARPRSRTPGCATCKISHVLSARRNLSPLRAQVLSHRLRLIDFEEAPEFNKEVAAVILMRKRMTALFRV